MKKWNWVSGWDWKSEVDLLHGKHFSPDLRLTADTASSTVLSWQPSTSTFIQAGSSFDLQLTNEARWSVSSGILLPQPLQGWDENHVHLDIWFHLHAYLHRFWGQTSGLCVCKASTLVIESSTQPLQLEAWKQIFHTVLKTAYKPTSIARKLSVTGWMVQFLWACWEPHFSVPWLSAFYSPCISTVSQ